MRNLEGKTLQFAVVQSTGDIDGLQEVLAALFGFERELHEAGEIAAQLRVSGLDLLKESVALQLLKLLTDFQGASQFPGFDLISPGALGVEQHVPGTQQDIEVLTQLLTKLPMLVFVGATGAAPHLGHILNVQFHQVVEYCLALLK